jgi:predicted transcriptional regulator
MRSYYTNRMPKTTTSVRLPDDLIEALDRRAEALGVTRSQLIIRAVEKAIADSTEWSPKFLDAIGSPREELGAVVDELMGTIARRRSRSEAPGL